jgi:large subunit ribosomal protein L3
MAMIQTILGSKQTMKAAYEDAKRIAVTQVIAGPCVVTRVTHNKTKGNWVIQLGFGSKKRKNTSKALQGHLKAILKEEDKYIPQYLREVTVSEEPTLKVGDKVTASDIFTIGDKVTVTGISKGKGFAGVVKRWHFRGGPKTHGQSDRHRAPGSIGQGTTPGRVYKGKHMAGRMGGDKVSVKNLRIVGVDPEKNTMQISGALPGTVGTLLIIKRQ